MEKYAFLFPGQGAHYIGMAKPFYEDSSVVRQTFEEASDILNCSMANICFSGTMSNLNRAENMQTALLTVSIAIYRDFFSKTGIHPHYCAGHSLGEYAALVSAGALYFTDALQIIKHRGELTQKLIDNNIGLMSICEQIELKKIETFCEKQKVKNHYVAISCFNAPDQVAISGTQEAIENVERYVRENGGAITHLIGSAPMHSELMKDIYADLQTVLSSVKFNRFRYPVIANVTGKPYNAFLEPKNILSEQIIKPVLWYQTIEYLKQHGVTAYIEMSPKNVLGNLVESLVLKNKIYSTGNYKYYKKVLSNLESHQIPSIYDLCLAAVASTKNNNLNQDGQTEIFEYTKELRKLSKFAQDNQIEIDILNVKDAIEILKEILKIKHISENDQKDIIINILEETNHYFDLKNVVIV